MINLLQIADTATQIVQNTSTVDANADGKNKFRRISDDGRVANGSPGIVISAHHFFLFRTTDGGTPGFQDR